MYFVFDDGRFILVVSDDIIYEHFSSSRVCMDRCELLCDYCDSFFFIFMAVVTAYEVVLIVAGDECFVNATHGTCLA